MPLSSESNQPSVSKVSLVWILHILLPSPSFIKLPSEKTQTKSHCCDRTINFPQMVEGEIIISEILEGRTMFLH